MFETCNRCGYVGSVTNNRLRCAPIMAFYTHGGRERYNIDIWLCDVCASEIRYQADAKLNSFKTTDETESKKGHEHV